MPATMRFIGKIQTIVITIAQPQPTNTNVRRWTQNPLARFFTIVLQVLENLFIQFRAILLIFAIRTTIDISIAPQIAMQAGTTLNAREFRFLAMRIATCLAMRVLNKTIQILKNLLLRHKNGIFVVFRNGIAITIIAPSFRWVSFAASSRYFTVTAAWHSRTLRNDGIVTAYSGTTWRDDGVQCRANWRRLVLRVVPNCAHCVIFRSKYVQTLFLYLAGRRKNTRLRRT